MSDNFIIALIKKLRIETQAGFADCKSAAQESEGNYTKAIEILKQKGIAKASKKAGNSTENGSIVIQKNDSKLVLLNFRTETDFASKSDAFCEFVNKEADILLNSQEISLENTQQDGVFFVDRLSFFASILGENLILNEQKVFKNDQNKQYFSYLHKKINDKFDNIACLAVIIEVSYINNEELNFDICQKIASHIAAMEPVVISKDDLTETMKNEMCDNENVVLLDQPYFYDQSITVSELLLKNDIKINSFNIYKA